MCGIAGIVANRTDNGLRMQSMLDALRHRGPDDEGTHASEGGILGQRRLSIIDLAGGHQPIANEDGSLWVVCNGEVYNYQALREDLHAKGHRFRTQSDSEVVLHLYEEMGERCVEQLRGMFAFAIWDVKQKRVFAARDRLGQKPLFYAVTDQGLIFASEIKALLAYDPTMAEVDPLALDQYLTLRLIAPPRSMFKRIRKLPPAHTLRYDVNSGLRIARYWDLAYEPKLEGSDEELVDQLEQKLIESLHLHMVSDVPVGAFLSGGLDSTLVVAMTMKHVATEPLQTFSMGLPYGRFDEAPYARMVAQRYGTVHHEKIMRPSLLDTLPQLVWHLDEPSDPLSVCAYLIAKMASSHVKVVLGGDGGDELFGGYDRYYGNRYVDRYARIPWAMRRFMIGPLLSVLPDGRWYKSPTHQIKWMQELSFLRGGKRYSRSLSYFYFGEKWRQTLYTPEFLKTLDTYDAEASIWEPYDRVNASDSVDRMLYADSQVRLPDHPVMIVDRMTMAHGLEARAPLMDHVVAEFAARLPARMKVRGRSLRYIQLRLAQRYLPEEVISRPKQGFSSALPYMLKDEYRQLYELFLWNSHLARDGYLVQKTIDQIVHAHNTGRTDNGNRLWLLVNSEAWYRMRIGGQSVSDMKSQIEQASASMTKAASSAAVA